MKKKLLAILLVTLMVISLVPFSALAEEDLTPTDFAFIYQVNLGFHCRDDMGSGGPRQWPIDPATGEDYTNKTAHDEVFGQVAENVWLLLKVLGKDEITGEPIYSIDTDYICPNCGSSRWVSYSNQSDMLGGAFDGQNMQINHWPGGGTTEFKGSLNFTKMKLDEDIYITAGPEEFSFNLFRSNDAGEKIGDAITTLTTDYSGRVELNFDTEEGFPDFDGFELNGWYLLEEKPVSGWQIEDQYKNGILFRLLLVGEEIVPYVNGDLSRRFDAIAEAEVYNDPSLGDLTISVTDKTVQDQVQYQNTYERDVWDIYERDVWDIYERDVWDIFERDVWDIFERDVWDIYERDVWDIYERDVWDIYERDVWDIFERDVWDIFERSVWDIFERDVWDIYERDVWDIYERDVWDIFERDVWDIFERNVWDIFERDVWDIFERSVWDIYERDVWDIYEQDIWDIYQGQIWDILQREVQPYIRPVFERFLNSFSGTLVSRLLYSGTDAKATATDGGAFNNGHTYVSIPADGTPKTIWIADSSSNSNGKKTPAEYNKPIDPAYSYTAQVVGNKLEITFDDRFVAASVGGYLAVENTKNNNGKGNNKGISIADMFPGNAPKHETIANGETLEFDLSSAAIIEGNYYLYLHLDKLVWLQSLDYSFKTWEEARRDYGEYKKVGEDSNDPVIIGSDASGYEKTGSDGTKFEQTGSDATEYKQTGSDATEYKQTGSDATEYKLTGRVGISRTTSTVSTNGKEYAYEVIDSTNAVVKSGTITSGTPVSVIGLLAGTYTVNLTGNGKEDTKTAIIPAGGSDSVSFGEYEFKLEDKVLEDAAPIYKDNHDEDDDVYISNHDEDDDVYISNHDEDDDVYISNHDEDDDVYISNHDEDDDVYISNHDEDDDVYKDNHDTDNDVYLDDEVLDPVKLPDLILPALPVCEDCDEVDPFHEHARRIN